MGNILVALIHSRSLYLIFSKSTQQLHYKGFGLTSDRSGLEYLHAGSDLSCKNHLKRHV